MFSSLIQFYGEYFSTGKDKYLLLKSSVCLNVCTGLYNQFISEGIAPLENIDLEKKKIYWAEVLKIYSTEEKRIQAYKTAYVLNLITSND